MRQIASCLLALILIAPHALRAQPAQRAPVPDDVQLKEAKKLVAEAYRRDYEAAKTPLQKRAFAKKLLDDAAKTSDDPAARYAMLLTAKNIATNLSDIDFAMQSAQQIAQFYTVDDAATRLELLTEIGGALKAGQDVLPFMRHARRTLSTLIKANDYETAAKLAELAVTVSTKSRDPDLKTEWLRRQQETAWRTSAYAALAPALAKLKESPADAAANALVGKYQCLVENRWESGLPMLALSDDKSLQPLAQRELRGDKPGQLASDWQAAAESLPEEMQVGALRRAEKWYRAALAMAQGLEQRRIEKEIDKLLPRTTLFRVNEWVDLLDFVDPTKDGINAHIHREGDGMVIEEHRDHGYFRTHVVANGSYEVRLRIRRLSNVEEGMGVRLPGLRGAVYFLNAYSGSISGVANVNGKDCNQNETTVPGVPQAQDVSYDLHLRVEQKGAQRAITAKLNGRNYSRSTVPLAALSTAGHGLGNHQAEFIVTVWYSRLLVEGFELKMLDGTASLID